MEHIDSSDAINTSLNSSISQGLSALEDLSESHIPEKKLLTKNEQTLKPVIKHTKIDQGALAQRMRTNFKRV